MNHRSVSLLSLIFFSTFLNACSLLSVNLDDDPVEREALRVREEPLRGSANRSLAGEGRFEGQSSSLLHIDPQEIRRALEFGEVILGMATDQVIAAWGNPSEVESAGDLRFGNQRWTYEASSGNHSHSKRVIYFENGLVAGWENPDARGP